LRLRAEDAEDLAVISACLQDALISVRDLAYDRQARNFVLVANRFRWEGEGTRERAGEGAGVEPRAEAGAPFERTLCGVTFEEIDGVAYRGFQRTNEDCILALLSIRPSFGPEIGEKGGVIDLEFAAGGTIRLSAAAIRCRARDFGEPWPTVWQPGHKLDEAE
jgi:hypothetical protein